MSVIQVLAIGLGLAGEYALMAVGFALIFATLRIFHIAHGTVFLTAGYAFYFLHQAGGMGLAASAILAIALAAAVGLAIDKAIYVPILRRGGGLFSIFIASLGIALIFEAAYVLATKGIVIVARSSSFHALTLHGIAFRWFDLMILAIVGAVYGLLYLWLYRTSVGLDVRGLTDNARLAAIVGVNVDRTRNYIFLIASAAAGIAGVLTVYDLGISPDTGMRAFFIALVAVILGGTRNILLGTIVGSIALGILTAFAGFLFPQWATLSVFMTMVLLIVIRPQGLLG